MKQFFKVTILSAIYTFVKMIAGFIIGKVIAVYTGPSGIAMLGQVQSLMNIATGIATAPVSNGLVRYTAENWQEGEQACSPWWSACLRIALIILILIIPCGILSSGYVSSLLFNSTKYSWLIIFAFSILPFSVANIMLISVINGQQKYREYLILGMLSVLISTVLMIILVINYGLVGALVSTALYSAIAGLIMVIFCLKKSWFRLRFWFATVEKKQLSSALNYTFMALVTAATMPLALLAIRKILINETGWIDTGHWQAVWKISEVYLGIITIALSTYFVPRLSTLKNSTLIRQEINKYSPFVILITIVLALIVFLFRDISIRILFTNEFYSARDLFVYQLIGDVLRIAGLLYAYPMVVQGRTKVYISSELVYSLLLVFLGSICIKNIGVQGANIAYLISCTAYFIFTFLFTNFFNVKFSDDKHNGE